MGNYTMGRRGQQTRLEVNQERLEYLFNKHPIDAAMDGWEDGNELDGGTLENQLDAEPFATVPDSFGEVIKPKDTVPEEIERLKVFISHGKNMEIVEQVKTMLELADLEYEVAVEEEATAIPVPEKVLSAMRSCSAAVICISADDQASIENGTSHINENVLIEIGAAFVLYDRRVVLLWDKRIPTPSNLQGLYSLSAACEFEGDPKHGSFEYGGDRDRCAGSTVPGPTDCQSRHPARRGQCLAESTQPGVIRVVGVHYRADARICYKSLLTIKLVLKTAHPTSTRMF